MFCPRREEFFSSLCLFLARAYHTDKDSFIIVIKDVNLKIYRYVLTTNVYYVIMLLSNK